MNSLYLLLGENGLLTLTIIIQNKTKKKSEEKKRRKKKRKLKKRKKSDAHSEHNSDAIEAASKCLRALVPLAPG